MAKLLSDDDVFGSNQRTSGSLLSDDEVFGTKALATRSSVARQLADVPIGLVGGVAGLINAGVGLGDIATGGKVGDAVNAMGDVADKVGVPTYLRPTQWQNQIQSLYTPEMQASKAAAHQSAVDAEEQAKAEGADWKGQIGASALGALKGIAQNPRAGIAAITENYGGMKAIAKGTEKVLARYLPEIDAAVKAGTITQAQADEKIADLAGKIAPAGEGVLTMGQNAQQVREEKPNATAGDYLLQVPAGIITGAISRGVGKIPGLQDAEATMALNAVGAKSGITGNFASRAAKGVLSEGILEELPQSAQEQVWQNMATGKPLQEGVGEQAIQGMVAGGAMGGGAAGMSALARTPRETAPLQRALQAGGAGAPATPGTDTSVRDLVQAAAADEANSTESATPAPPSSAQPTTPGVTHGNQEATPSQAAGPLLNPAGEATSGPTSPAGVSPEPINTPAAPESASSPVSTAAPIPPTNQAESAGAPIPQGKTTDGNQAEITVPAVSGQQAQPTAAASAADSVGSSGNPAGKSPGNTGATRLWRRSGAGEMPAEQDVNLQNRDRGRAASVAQMQSIAKNPDYLRLGPSRTPDSGAPMVFAVGDADAGLPGDAFGHKDVAVMSDGQRVPFVYAVVDASKVQPSHFADGRANPEFQVTAPGTLKALNNGRTAGIRAAYGMGTAGSYLAEMKADAENHGIAPEVIDRTPKPMLVRVYSDDANAGNMAAKSQGQGLGMSPGELARQDAPLFDSSILSLFRPGEVAGADNRAFVRAFVGKLQQSGQDVAGMMTNDGTLSPAGRSRIQAALMQAAYGDADLVAEMFDSIDTDIKAIGEALKVAAGPWANMRDSARLGSIDPQVDITENLIRAVRLIQQSRRDRTSLIDLVNQRDIETGEAVSDLTAMVLRLFYTGPNLTRAVGKDRLTTELDQYVAGAMQTSADASLFGDRVTAYDVLQSIIGREQNAEDHSRQPESGGAPRRSVDQEGTGGQRQRGAEGGQEPADRSQTSASEKPGAGDEASSQGDGAERPGLTLQGQSPEEIAAGEAEDKARAGQEAKAQQEKGWKLLWSGASVPTVASGADPLAASPPEAGAATTMTPGQSSDSSLANEAGEGKPERPYATEADHEEDIDRLQEMGGDADQTVSKSSSPANTAKLDYAGSSTQKEVSHDSPDAGIETAINQQVAERQQARLRYAPARGAQQNRYRPGRVDDRGVRGPGRLTHGESDESQSVGDGRGLEAVHDGQLEQELQGEGNKGAVAETGDLDQARTVFSKAGSASISHADSAIYTMAQEGKSAADILGFISEASRKPFNRYLAKALRAIGVSPSITLDSMSRWNFGEARPGARYAAAYNPKTDTVALFTPREAERHVLHELIHAATLKAIAKGGPAAMQMRALFRHVQKSGELDGQYGMSNIDEFVAEAFSNPKFQQALRDVPAPAGSTLKNAWQWFVRAVARILGIRVAARETALDRVMREGAALMRENAALSGVAQGADRYAIAWHGTPHVWAPEPGFPHGRPRLDKMGSGEGAQAYGWGWYSAEARAVAKGYADRLGPLRGRGYSTQDRMRIIGANGSVTMPKTAPQQRAWRSLHEAGGWGNVADAYETAKMFRRDDPQALMWLEKWQLQGVKTAEDSGGALYQLDIPDDVMPHLLDWDNRIAQQPTIIKKLLAGASKAEEISRSAARVIKHMTDKEGEHNTGKDLYERLATYLGPKEASKYLASIGIVGNRYLDGNSRSDGKGTRNYVIWDQPTLDRIALLERNGEKLDAIRAADAVRYSSADALPPTITINGAERPTTNSKGQALAQDEAGVRNFWKWFGDSKVVDGQGRPRVVYHGTTASIDGAFRDGTQPHNRGIFFTDSPNVAASVYARGSEVPNVEGIRAAAAKLSPPEFEALLGRLRRNRRFDFEPETYDGAPTPAEQLADYAESSFDPSEGMGEVADVIARELGVEPRLPADGSNVVPVYLALQSPLSIDARGAAFDAEQQAEWLDQARASGNDGVIVRNYNDGGFGVGNTFQSAGRHTVFIAFEPELVKSAIGNNGQFSPANPDVRYNISGTTAPNANPWQRAKAKAAAVLSPERMDKVIYELQDKYIDLKRLRDYIRSINGVITDMNDAYLGEELYHQRLAHRTKEFLENEEKPLLAAMRAGGVSIEELETFLHARHAPEANAEMAKRNPNQAEIDAGQKAAEATVRTLERKLQTAQARGLSTTALEQALNDARGKLANWNGAQAFRGTEAERLSLSGMSDQAAAAVMSSLSPERRATLDALASRVDAINEGTLQTLEDYGLMSKEALREWRKTYRYYIPLRRDEAHPDSASHPIGQGFSTKGDAAKRRTGSNAEVTNILAHVMMQRAAALRRGEKNHVMLKLYLMARQNPLEDVWKIDAVPTIDTVDKATGFVKSVPDPQYRTRPNVLMLRIAGKDVAITMNEHNPEALRMAQALKNLDVDDLHYIIPMFAKVTRWFAAMATQYNPIFGIINLMRDTQDAALNLSSTELAGKQKDVLKDQASILKDVIKNGGRMPKSGQWADLYREFQEVGGTTGYTDLYLDAESRGKELEKTLQSFDHGKAKQAWHAVADWLSDYNEAMENSTRLAAYKAALESGMSKERAASLAKNLTVNFNRKGRQTRELGALYAFFNAAIQGTARMLETLKGPAGRKIIAGGVALGALDALLGIAMMGGGSGDDDEWDKIPDFVKERAIIIPLGKQDYFSIPLPLGFQFLPNIGRMAVETAVYKDKSAGKQFAKLFNVMADAFNPLGGGSTPLEQMPFPTVVRPTVALMENKDWTGKSIYIENRNSLSPQPGFKRSKDSATPWAKGISWGVNAATGGTDYTPGAVSWTPDQIDYVIQQLTGGVGREVSKTAATVSAPFTGEELPPYKMPLVGRLYGSTAGHSGQSEKFYENITRANEAENEIKGRAKDGIGAADYLRENPWATELAARGNAAEHQIAELRKMRHEIVLRDGADKVARVREINNRISEAMRGFNRAAERLQ